MLDGQVVPGERGRSGRSWFHRRPVRLAARRRPVVGVVDGPGGRYG
ncbi:hypothetical protein [Streptosporangium fragile]